MEEDGKAKERIRQRSTHKFWSDILCLIRKRDKKKVLNELYELLDSRHGFGSETNAIYNRESLDVLLEDKGMA